MSSSSGFPPIRNSITDTVILDQNVIDNDAPIPFSKFQTIVGYYNDDIKEYYTDYIRKWNEVKKTSNVLNNEEILERYKNFVREIAINYNTIEERNFFERLDFDDIRQLEMSIPFFTEKIKSIAEYYRGKREDIKFQTVKNKSVGTKIDIENKLKEYTINYIENLPNSEILYDIANIKNNIDIEIRELFDEYPLYFNQTPNQQIYDFKDLDYGLDIFLKTDDILISEIFGDVSEELLELKEIANLFEAKRKETRKNISSNFYFISTGNTNTQFVSGLLFENNNSIGNFFNKNYPTTATTPKGIYKNKKDVGFFKPQKTSIVVIDGKRDFFTINVENLKPNSLYYFPDPLLHGDDDFLSFIINVDNLVKNQTSGKAASEPIITSSDTLFHGYKSEISIENTYLQNVYNHGYVKDSKKDVYGNLYGLFSNDDNFKSSYKIFPEKIVKSLQLDGHLFFDNVYNEGFLFDYTLVDTSPNNHNIRSGIITNTGNFDVLSGYYTLFGRYFSPYEELYDPKKNDVEYLYYDGGFLTGVDDPLSSDLAAFPNNNSYYYDLLLEGGIHSVSPLQRALLDSTFPNLTARFIPNINNPDEITTFNIDCGLLSDVFIYDYDFKSPNYKFDNTLLCGSNFTIENFTNDSYIKRKELEGMLFVRNTYDGNILPISNGIPYLSSIMSSNVINSITFNTKKFEIVNDTIYIETDQYFVIFKIGFNGVTFDNPKKSPIIIPINSTPFHKISERYYHKNFVYFNLINAAYPLSSKNIDIAIDFYRTNIEDLNIKLMNTENLTLSSDSVVYDKMDSFVLTYSEDDTLFNTSILLKDQNYLFDLLDISYNHKPFQINQISLHENAADSYSNIDVTTVNMLSSSNVTTLSSPYLLIL
jgi:hypothetical protein